MTRRDFTRDLRRAGYLDDDDRIDLHELARDEPLTDAEERHLQDRADAWTYGDNPNLP